MTILQAIILGLVEGFSEFLPISSTGHLILTQKLMGLESSVGLNAYLIAIQFGAILAVVALYPKRFGQCFSGVRDCCLGKWSSPDSRYLLSLAIAFLPAAVVGLLLDDWIETTLFGVTPVLLALLVGAALMVLMGKARKNIEPKDEPSLWGGLRIGLWQIISLWPGMSRSMSTIIGGYRSGLNAAAAAEFSFVLGALILTAASLYKGIGAFEEIMALGVAPVLVGIVTAFVSAFVVMRLFVKALTRFGLVPWAIYRVVLVVILLGLGIS